MQRCEWNRLTCHLMHSTKMLLIRKSQTNKLCSRKALLVWTLGAFDFADRQWMGRAAGVGLKAGDFSKKPITHLLDTDKRQQQLKHQAKSTRLMTHSIVIQRSTYPYWADNGHDSSINVNIYVRIKSAHNEFFPTGCMYDGFCSIN